MVYFIHRLNEWIPLILATQIGLDHMMIVRVLPSTCFILVMLHLLGLLGTNLSLLYQLVKQNVLLQFHVFVMLFG